VTHVARGSPADVVGWKASEVINTVNGQAIAANYATSPQPLWQRGQGVVGAGVDLRIFFAFAQEGVDIAVRPS